MRERGGNCLKYLKRGWNRKKGRENKDFKKRGRKLGRGVGALKSGDWNPLTNYGMYLDVYSLWDVYSLKYTSDLII